MIKILSIYLILFYSTLGLSEEKPENEKRPRLAAATTGSEFYIEKGLVDKVYSQTTSQEEGKHIPLGSMRPQVGILSPRAFSIKNDYFEIDYAEQMGNIPFVGLDVAKHIYQLNRVGFYLNGELGYTYQQGTLKAQSSSGTEVEDSVTLQWIPIIVGLAVDYDLPWSRLVKPMIDVGGGASWVHHTGTIDGLDHSEWVPEYGAGLSLLLFPSLTTSGGMFGGITIGAAYKKSTSDKQKIEGWEYKLGSSIIL